jgi:hypothetical protein
MLRQPREDFRRLRRSLALSENHLWHARAQRAVMVNFGKSKIFKGQMAKAVDRIVGGELALAYLLK